jgi:hypothetical protein
MAVVGSRARRRAQASNYSARLLSAPSATGPGPFPPLLGHPAREASIDRAGHITVEPPGLRGNPVTKGSHR